MRSLFFLCLFLFSFNTFSNNLTYGHNVSHTAYTFFDDQHFTVGSQVAAFGNEKWMVGVSPMLVGVYNMLNLYGRYRLNENLTLELAYFDTFSEDTETYAMNGYGLHFIYLQKLSSKWNIHYNFQFQYYSQDRYPYSIRRPTENRNEAQVNISALNEWTLTNDLFLLGEAGVLHLTDPYPRLHLGSSLGVRFDEFVFTLGGSVTSTFHALYNNPLDDSYDYHRSLLSKRDGYNRELEIEKIRRDVGFHAESTLQYFF